MQQALELISQVSSSEENAIDVGNIDLLEHFQPNDFKPIIIGLLTQRTHKSASLEVISKEVLKRCGILTRKSVRKAYYKKIRESINRLIRSKILEKYQTSTNVRIRLTKDFEIRCKKLKLFYLDGDIDKILARVFEQATDKRKDFTDQTNDELRDAEVSDIEDIDLGEHFGERSVEIPDLFTTLGGNLVSDGIDIEEESTLDNSVNDDNEDLLNVLTGDDYASEEEVTSQEVNVVEVQDLFGEILQVLESLSWLEIKDSNPIRNEIHLSVYGRDIETLLKYDTEQHSVLLKSFFDYHSEEIEDILEVSGAMNFNSVVGISLHKRSKALVVRRKANISDIHALGTFIKTYFGDIQKIHEVVNG